ncbi:MAG: hypothetical protein CO149_08045 [Nitrospirae bacterium CG_4_9_14_3_um_filter_51_5]|nr:MAG: hypothetical protein CO149_08045 [Nitrospirae bacterium CG_4_9_14_3_um_filter_51_5]
MNTPLLAGKIERQREIAKGQTGTIYYGYDLELRQEMAIKVYHTHIKGRLIPGKAFIEKAKPLLRLEHPNLIKIFKVDEQNGTPVVCMEFFDAPNLQHVIHEEGPLSVQQMLLLAREIAEVLVHIHFQGIIHGTLHPGHVLVGPQGRIKVMDIGLSWILMDILTNCDAELLRPLPYLLPEIAKGELLTLSSDLYCLGFMMYDMLTKRVPYSGLPKTSIMGKLAFDQADPVFDFPDHIPKAICELIRQMTRNHSSHRLQDATHVLTILNQQLAKFPPDRSSPPTAPAEPQPRPESHTAKIAAPASPTQAPVSVLSLNQPPVVNRPRHSTDDQRMHRADTRKKSRMTFGIILLLLIGGTMGYVYREQLDIPVLSSSPEFKVPNQPPISEPAPPAPPIDSFTAMPPEIPISPPPNISTTEEPRVKTHDPSNRDTSMRTIPTPPPPAIMETEDPPLKLNASQHLGTPVPSLQERTRAQSPISTPQPKPETKPVPEQPNTAPPQDNSSIVNQPFSKKTVSPVTELTPKTSAIISETGQAASPTITKKPAFPSDLPSELSPNRPQPLQDSTSPSPNTASLDNFESKELKEILDSVQIPETVTPLPTDGPNPSLPSLPSLPALSSPESSP